MLPIDKNMKQEKNIKKSFQKIAGLDLMGWELGLWLDPWVRREMCDQEKEAMSKSKGDSQRCVDYIRRDRKRGERCQVCVFGAHACRP